MTFGKLKSAGNQLAVHLAYRNLHIKFVSEILKLLHFFCLSCCVCHMNLQLIEKRHVSSLEVNSYVTTVYFRHGHILPSTHTHIRAAAVAAPQRQTTCNNQTCLQQERTKLNSEHTQKSSAAAICCDFGWTRRS